MRKYILKNIMLPLAAKCSSNKGWDYYGQYIQADFDPAEIRRKRRWAKLMRVVDHAYQNVPFYRKKYDEAGITPADIRCEEDFRRLPVITKKELREFFPKNVIAQNYPKEFMRFSNTSGTTGAGLMLVHDHEDINYKYASKLRSRYLMGCDVNDSILRLAPNECQPCLPDGQSPEVGLRQYLQMALSRHKYRRQAYYIFVERHIANSLINNRRFPPPLEADFTDNDILAYIKEIQRFRPQIITGYPVYLYLCARYLQKHPCRLPACKGIDLTAGVSTRAMRQFIGEQFHAPVFQSYGGCELGRIASSCPHSDGLMHILEEQCYIEFIKNSGEKAQEGELANIIVTALNSYGMPFIRYEHGDVGKFHNQSCACRRTSQLMDVAGRLQDLIISREGAPIPSKEVIGAFLDYPGVKLFQCIQRNAETIDFKVVKDDPSVRLDIEQIKKGIKSLLGDRIDIDVQEVDYIRSASSGKYRLVRSATYEPFRCVEEQKRPLGNYW